MQQRNGRKSEYAGRGSGRRERREESRGPKRRRSSGFFVFVKTLLVILLVGIGILHLWKYVYLQNAAEHWDETDGFWAVSKTIFRADEKEWENIPEHGDAELENGKNAGADDGGLVFDEFGFVRDENGRITDVKKETDSVATMLFAGDILFDDGYAVMTKMRARPGGIEDCFSPETLKEMRAADIFMLNNEFPYSLRGTPREGKAFTFRAKPDTARQLCTMGADVVSLANNHAYDFGEEALLDSFTTLNDVDMPFVGAGLNIEDASKTIRFHTSGGTIAVISATQIERLDHPDTRGATPTSAGVFRCLTEQKIFEKITEAKDRGEFVVVYVHWGTESTNEPDWSQPKLAKELEAAGADLIIGDHPHVLQPISRVNHVPVVYSLGNYWFNSTSMDTCLVKAAVMEGQLESLQFIPARQSDCYTYVLQDEEKERVLSYMRSISPDVTIDENGYVIF